MVFIDELEETDSIELLIIDLRDLLTFALQENQKIQKANQIEEVRRQSALCQKDLESMVKRLLDYEKGLQNC